MSFHTSMLSTETSYSQPVHVKLHANNFRIPCVKGKLISNSRSELKETVNKLNVGSRNHEQTAQSAVDERTVYNSVAKSFCNCWNDTLSILKKSVRKEQSDKIPFSKWDTQTNRFAQTKIQSDRLSLSCLRLQHESLEDRNQYGENPRTAG